MDLFPVTIAVGNAFCNRTEERKHLSKYIESGRHTVIIAPRRYGKSSLINQVLYESKFEFTILVLAKSKP